MRLLNFSEAFAHGLGVAALFAILLAVDRSLALPWPGRAVGARNEFLRLVAATAAGGLSVDVIKLMVARVRPRAADLGSVTSAFGTFGLSALAEPDPRPADLMSFPSGHAAVAAGFAAALGWRYRHAAPAFAAIAGLAVLQRVATSAHYPSDVAFGAAMGLLGAALSLGADAAEPPTAAADSMADSERA
jgi:membrane-associated phospholipid phosphatase